MMGNLGRSLSSVPQDETAVACCAALVLNVHFSRRKAQVVASLVEEDGVCSGCKARVAICSSSCFEGGK